jgi:hypothetical protein
MSYSCGNAGRVDEDPSEAGKAQFFTFDDVQQRMVDAMLLWQRSPDRERGWLHVKAFWPEVRRFHWTTAVGGEHDHPEEDPQPRPLPLTRAEVAEMNAVGDWMRFVPERDRKLVALALARLARGDKQVPWLQLKRVLGVPFGADGLRMRYSRAIAGVAAALNRQNSATMASQ